MKMTWGGCGVGMCLTLGLVAGALALPAHFDDPLQQPAQITSLALDSTVLAVAQTGDAYIAVGQRGHILRKPSAGADWAQIPAPVSTDLVAVAFPTTVHGWAVGHDGVVLSTEDGGRTWHRRLDGRQAWQIAETYYEGLAAKGDETGARELKYLKKVADQGPAWPFLDVWFRNDSEGYLVGTFGMIMRTTDGGSHWTPLMERTENRKQLHLYAVRGDGDDVFIAGEQGLVLRLDRKTGRFDALSLPYQGALFGVAVQQERILVYGLGGHVLLSEDRGSTWRTLETGTTQSVVGYAARPDRTLLLVTQGGKILQLSPGRSQLSTAGLVMAGEVFGIVPEGKDGAVVATSTGPKSVRLGGRL